MTAPLREKNDIKIFMMYLIREVGIPLDYGLLHDVCVGEGMVRSFDFTECLQELVEAGNISVEPGKNGEVYRLTEQGERVSRTLSSNIMRSIRETSLRSALRYISLRATGTVFYAEVGEEDISGRCPVHCVITRRRAPDKPGGAEERETLLDLTVWAASCNQAELMKRAFEADPELVLKNIHESMSGTYQQIG